MLSLNRIKHTSLVAILAIGFVQCSAPESNDIASKKVELTELRLEYKSLEEKIKTLESEIQDLDTSSGRQAIMVNVREMSPIDFTHYASVEGVVESKTDVLVSAEFQGQITSINVEEGEKVRKGQLLATLNNQVTQSQLSELRTRYALAKDLFERQERLWLNNKIGSELQYLESKNTKEALEQNIKSLEAQLEMTYIRAPHSGRIDEIFLKVGSFASPQAPFAQLVGLEDLYIRADLSESYLPKVNKGDSVQIHFEDLGIKTKGKIMRIGSVINPQNRSFTVDVSLKNESGLLRPNALASLTFKDYFNEEALVLPSNAVQQDAKGYYVFVMKGEEGSAVAEKRYVETGLSNDRNQTEVVSGLTSGDKVVVQGYNQISNGVPISLR